MTTGGLGLIARKVALANPLGRSGGFPRASKFREITTVSRHAMDHPRWGGLGQKNRRHKIASVVMGSVVMGGAVMGASFARSIIIPAHLFVGGHGLAVWAAHP